MQFKRFELLFYKQPSKWIRSRHLEPRASITETNKFHEHQSQFMREMLRQGNLIKSKRCKETCFLQQNNCMFSSHGFFWFVLADRYKYLTKITIFNFQKNVCLESVQWPRIWFGIASSPIKKLWRKDWTKILSAADYCVRPPGLRKAVKIPVSYAAQFYAQFANNRTYFLQICCSEWDVMHQWAKWRSVSLNLAL